MKSVTFKNNATSRFPSLGGVIGFDAFHLIEGASHYDRYGQPEATDKAVPRLAPFYGKHLGA